MKKDNNEGKNESSQFSVEPEEKRINLYSEVYEKFKRQWRQRRQWDHNEDKEDNNESKKGSSPLNLREEY